MGTDAKEKNKVGNRVENIIQMGEGALLFCPVKEVLWSRDQEEVREEAVRISREDHSKQRHQQDMNEEKQLDLWVDGE